MNCTYTKSKPLDNSETAQITFVDQNDNMSTLNNNLFKVPKSPQSDYCLIIETQVKITRA